MVLKYRKPCNTHKKMYLKKMWEKKWNKSRDTVTTTAKDLLLAPFSTAKQSPFSPIITNILSLQLPTFSLSPPSSYHRKPLSEEVKRLQTATDMSWLFVFISKSRTKFRKQLMLRHETGHVQDLTPITATQQQAGACVYIKNKIVLFILLIFFLYKVEVYELIDRFDWCLAHFDIQSKLIWGR